MKRPIYYDLETTGIDAKTCEIVEIAAYDPTLEREFVSFVRPRSPIPPDATRIHGITDAMVENAPLFAEIGQKFIDFCQGDVVLIAHNGDAFDSIFLLYESKRHLLKLPGWPQIDTLKWARKYRPDLPKHSLQFLRMMYGIAENQAHRALDDVKTLYRIFSAMIGDLEMEQVMQLLNNEDVLEYMPFGKYRGKPLSTLPLDYVKWLKKEGALDKSENVHLKKALDKLFV